MADVNIRVLGSLEVDSGGESVPVTGRQARIILSLLAARAGTAVSTDSIIDTIWPEEPPARPRKTVQVYIANLRKALGGNDSPILSVPNGYSLALDGALVDIHRFDELLAEADRTRDEPSRAIALLTEATGLWRGEPFADVDLESLRSEVSRLVEARLVAIERRIELELEQGQHARVMGELEALTLEHPYREGLRAQHMLALYRAGRQAEALRAYTRTRDVLAEELGIEPSPELQNLEAQVLAQSPDLDLIVPIDDSARTATFLVTDLEDSSALWETDPDAMARALSRHDEIIGDAIRAAGGEVFKGTGDGVLAVLPDVGAAASAATVAQRRLANESWEVGPLQVRMAIDTGIAEFRDGDYFGAPLTRACRVMSSGHGGQILLTAEALSTTPDTEVIELGAFDYKGVGRIVVHQLEVEDLNRDFPPLQIDRAAIAIPRRGFDNTIRGYELRERLGEGDFGIVYRAYQASVGREVAIKVIRPEYANRPSFVRQFEVEAQLVAQIEHPHVVSLYDYWREPDGAYLVMRWLRGGSLRSSLDRGPFDAPAAMRLLDQVGSALASAHRQGVIHSDIKPANVLLDDEGNAYLSDFGIAARRVDSDGGPLSTSPAYVSPEEIAGRTPTASSDIYSLGMLAHELLTAVHPVSDQARRGVSEIRPELSPAIDVVIDQATASDPAMRFGRTEDFLRAMRQALGADVVVDLSLGPDSDVRNPYRGLRAFQEPDAADFFGRDALIDELIEQVEQRPLVAVVGPSGSGKSSVVRAGLLPNLRRAGSERPWFITEMYPGSYPFEELEGALDRVATDRLVGVSEELRADELGLVRAVKRVLPNDDSRLLLLIDQFEEIFSLTTDEATRDLFIANLVAAANDARGRLTIVVTMRADFFDRPLSYSEFGGLMRAGLVAVAMPTEESLALAVSRPARGAGLELEAGLVTEIVRDVADQPGGLPLMQHALSELFQRRRGRTLTIDDYRDSGGVLGALSRRADEIYRGLGEGARAAARQVFLRLVRADESAEDTRRRVRRSELDSLGIDRHLLDNVLQEFGRFRLLSFDRDPVTRGPTVEVAHEALIKEWDRLREWVDDRREDLLLERRLAASTREWTSTGRDPGYLLREGRLAQFETWADRTDVHLTADEHALLEASRADADEADERAARRRRGVVMLVGAFAVVALVLATFALVQRNNARDATFDAVRQGREARAKELAALAVGAIEEDPELATLLALEATDVAAEAGVELPAVTSAVYDGAFADRLVRTFTVAETSVIFLQTSGIEYLNQAGTQGMRPHPRLDQVEFSLAPVAVDVVDLMTGEVIRTISDVSGLSGYGWDPVTGEVLTLSLAGEMVWLDPVTFEPTRSLTVLEGAMFPSRVGDLISYVVFTDISAFDLQTHVIDAVTGELIFSGPPDAFMGGISPSEKYLMIVDDRHLIRIYDIAAKEAIAVLDVPAGGLDPGGVTWAVDRDAVFFTPDPGGLWEYDPLLGEVVTPLIDSADLLDYFVQSPDGLLLAGVTNDGEGIAVFAVDDFAQVAELPGHDAALHTISWANDGRTLVTSAAGGSTNIWDLGEETTAAATIAAIRDDTIYGFGFLRDEKVLLTTVGGAAQVWDISTRSVVRSYEGVSLDVSTQAFASSNGDRIAVPIADTSVAVFDSSSGELIASTPPGAFVPRRLSADGALLATSVPVPDPLAQAHDSGYKVFDVRTGQVVVSSDDDSGDLIVGTAAEFSPDGDVVIFTGWRQPPSDSEFGSVSGGLPFVEEQYFLAVYDTVTGQLTAELSLPDRVFHLAVASAGNLLAATDLSGVLHLYDLNRLHAGDGADALLGTADVGLFGVVFSADGELVLSGSPGAITARTADAMLRVAWSIDLGVEQPTILVVHDGYVWTSLSERIDRDGGTRQGLVGFPIDYGELVDFARSKLSRGFTELECQQYLGIDSCADRS